MPSRAAAQTTTASCTTPPISVAQASTMPARARAGVAGPEDEHQRGDQHDVEERRREGGGGEAAAGVERRRCRAATSEMSRR